MDIYNSLDIKKILQEEINNSVKNNSFPQTGFTGFDYKNHELIGFQLNPFLSEELFMKMNEITKKQVNKLFENYDKADNIFYVNINERRVDLNYDNCFPYINFSETDGVIEYIKEHINDEINMNDRFYVFNIGYPDGESVFVFLKETDELDFIIERDRFYDSVGVVEPYYNEFEDMESFEENIQLY